MRWAQSSNLLPHNAHALTPFDKSSQDILGYVEKHRIEVQKGLDLLFCQGNSPQRQRSNLPRQLREHSLGCVEVFWTKVQQVSPVLRTGKGFREALTELYQLSFVTYIG